MTARISVGLATAGHYIVHAGHRWQVTAARTDPSGATQLTLIRTVILPPDQMTATWLTSQPVTLTGDQGFCGHCGRSLGHGLGDNAHQFRDVTERYACPDSGDARHHPRLLAPPAPPPASLTYAQEQAGGQLADTLGEAIAAARAAGLAPEAIRSTFDGVMSVQPEMET
jgi:hypothetical protein